MTEGCRRLPLELRLAQWGIEAWLHCWRKGYSGRRRVQRRQEGWHRPL